MFAFVSVIKVVLFAKLFVAAFAIKADAVVPKTIMSARKIVINFVDLFIKTPPI